MNETNTLPALRENLAAIPLSSGKALELQNIGNAFALAELVVKAGFAPKGATIESCVVAMIEGSTIGLNPLQAVQGISVVNGRPALWGDALVAVVKGSPVFGGERIEWLKGDENAAGCRVTVWRKGGEANPTVEQFTVADAKRAGLWGKQGPWTQYPRAMLRHRAVALAYRQAFADVLKGVRYAEEERDVIDVTPITPAVAPAPTTAPTKGAKLRRSLGLAAPAPKPPTVALDTDAAPEAIPSFAPCGEEVPAEEQQPAEKETK